MVIALAILAMHHPTRLLSDGCCRIKAQPVEKV